MTYSVYWYDGHTTGDIKTLNNKREAIAIAKRKAKKHDVESYGYARFSVCDDEDNVIASFDSAFDPDPPKCSAKTGHRWEDKSGPYGSGGGVSYSESCKRCGVVKFVDTWGSHPLYPAMQGYRRVSFQKP